MSSSSASNDEKPSPNQSAFWWLIGLATLLLLGSTWIAWQQPPHPSAAPEWLGTVGRPIEKNAFKRVTLIKTDLQAVFVLGQRVWAVGERGLIVHSADGGISWQQQTSNTNELLSSITFQANGQHGWVAGDNGTILKTSDGGLSWQPQTSNTSAVLSSITFQADGQHGWAAGRNGTILKTSDGGESWQPQTSGTNAWLNSITFQADGRHGWAAGGNGAILKTSDGGESWQPQTSSTDAWLNSIAFLADGRHGWAAGTGGTILKTSDGGESWQPQTSGTNAWLNSITFQADGRHGWAAGGNGAILKTSDGGLSWQPQTSNTSAVLSSITFQTNGQNGWAADTGGTILKTSDGGESWQPQTSNTNESLNSITFHADGQHGWAAGDNGTILKTSDGGISWHPITYRFYPAPWFYIAVLVALLIYAAAFRLRARRIQQQGPVIHTITDHVATDKPSSPGDPDFLGARRIAAGLTRFLTNTKTEPPLTLAITGDWGSGKSSLMNYLFASLKREGLRPVWFNAWHHREEQNVLASIWPKYMKKQSRPGGTQSGSGFADGYGGGGI